MGKPAARMGDTTSHGGTVMGTAATVLIGGAPAATLGDNHVCPMQTPGTPPIPHVGGPITLGSAGVFICGKPAARQGDMCVCTGPPDTIAMGCPTVLIGETGGGGGGGGAGGGSGDAGQGDEGSGEGGEAGGGGGSGAADTGEAEGENHFLDVSMVDRGGYPIVGPQVDVSDPDSSVGVESSRGRHRRVLSESGSHDFVVRAITRVRWSAREVELGQDVDLELESSGFDDGTFVAFNVFVADSGVPDMHVATIESQVRGDRATGTWTTELTENFLETQRRTFEARDGYSNPQWKFVAVVGAVDKTSDGLLLHTKIETRLTDDENNALANTRYHLILPNGQFHGGETDGDGWLRHERMPAGHFRVRTFVRS